MSLATPCIPWGGRLDSEGYGREQRETYAHRAAWERERGPIPAGLTIDHLCRNRACVNTGHMEIVTRAENVLRGISPPALNARKARCPRGHVYDRVKATGRRRCSVCDNALARARYTPKGARS